MHYSGTQCSCRHCVKEWTQKSIAHVTCADIVFYLNELWHKLIKLTAVSQIVSKHWHELLPLNRKGTHTLLRALDQRYRSHCSEYDCTLIPKAIFTSMIVMMTYLQTKQNSMGPKNVESPKSR
jgi:hypothetical protein